MVTCPHIDGSGGIANWTVCGKEYRLAKVASSCFQAPSFTDTYLCHREPEPGLNLRLACSLRRIFEMGDISLDPKSGMLTFQNHPRHMVIKAMCLECDGQIQASKTQVTMLGAVERVRLAVWNL